MKKGKQDLLLNKKQLVNMAKKAVEASFDGPRLDEVKVGNFIQIFRKLPTAKAILVLEEFQKGLKRQLDRFTLKIESASNLRSSQIKEITSALKADYPVQAVQVISNPDLIGGIKIRIGDIVFDDSLAERIEKLREELS